MTTWVTRAQAADILGAGIRTVDSLRDRGILTSRGPAGPGRGVYDLDHVIAVREQRARDAAARARRDATPRTDRRPQPPDTDHNWLTTGQTATLLGISVQAVKQQCDRDQLAHTWHHGRRWIRRDLLEQRQAARHAQKARLQ